MTKTPIPPTPTRGPKATLAYTQRAQHAGVADTAVAPPPRMTAPSVASVHTATTVLSPSPSSSSPSSSSSLAPPTGARSTVLPRLSRTMDSAAPELVRDERPRYEAVRHLGAGAQADVTLAHDHDIDRTVALKRLRPEDVSDGAVLRFAEEVRTVGQLEHPNIVPIHDVGVDGDGQYFFVMKYVEGETLEAVIEKLREGDLEYQRRYTPEYRIQICNEILRGVEHAHARGILHRDLKPANIMIGARGEVVVMDWGLSKREQDAPADAGGAAVIMGTPAYMSPEQAAGRADALGVESDVYSLAVMFYELFCLRHPRAQHTSVAAMIASVTTDEIRGPQILADFARVGAPPALAHFVRHGLVRDPKRRYSSVLVMRQRLDAVRDGKAPIECHATFAQWVLHGLSRGVDRHPYALLVFLFVTTVGMLGGAGSVAWSLLH